MTEKKNIELIHYCALIILFILLFTTGGVLWSEFKNTNYLGEESNSICGVIGSPLAFQGNLNYSEGKNLFSANCQKCHILGKESTGPNLLNVRDRWPDSTKLYSFIKDSQSFIKTGDLYANDLYEEYVSLMPSFPNLTDSDIYQILNYCTPGIK